MLFKRISFVAHPLGEIAHLSVRNRQLSCERGLTGRLLLKLLQQPQTVLQHLIPHALCSWYRGQLIAQLAAEPIQHRVRLT